jgi:hypothetical protein
MAFIYDLTDTWNAGGTTFNAIKMNVTDTASAAASKLITVQVSGSEKFSVKKDGVGYFAGNVGIGTSSPTNLLDLNGGITVQQASDVKWQNTARNTTYGGISSLASALQFKWNDAEVMRITSAGSVGIGTTSPSALLDVAGDAEINGLTVGRGAGDIASNTAYGLNALSSNTTGFNNTASGRDTLFSNTTGNNNAAYGLQALYSNTTGSSNVASGYLALYSNTTGSSNVASGYQALRYNTTGAANTASGRQALYSNTTGNSNVASGYAAGYENTEGTQNTYIGYNTGRGITTGNYNTIVGAGVTGLSASLSNNVIIADGQGNRRINIDSSGSVGIGTTSPSAVGSRTTVNVSGSAGSAIRLSDDTANTFIDYTDGSGARISVNAAEPLLFQTNSLERMRIDSSGNVGIGTTSPSSTLDVAGATGIYQRHSTGGRLVFDDTDTADASTPMSYISNSSGSLQFGRANRNASTGLTTSSVEAMRIDSSGNLLVGKTSIGTSTVGVEARPGGVLTATCDAAIALYLRRNTSDGSIVQFQRDSTTVGSISVTTSATAYNTSSDARLKHDIVDAPEASSLIDGIKVRSFKWNADDSEQRYGMVAQELVEVAPEAVSVQQDEDEMMGVDYSKLVPMLVKEIQSLRARVAQLEG